MDDVNLLPENLREREEKERQRQARPASIPMSTPQRDDEVKRSSLVVGQSAVQASPSTDAPAKLRMDSYIKSLPAEPAKAESAGIPAATTRRQHDSLLKRLWPSHATPTASVPTPTAVPTRAPAIEPAASTSTVPPPAPSAVMPAVAVPPKTVTAPSASPAAPAAAPARPIPGFNAGEANRNSLGVNLLPAEWFVNPVLPANHRLRVLVVMAALSGLVVVGSVAGRTLYAARQAARSEALTTEQQQLATQIATFDQSAQQWRSLRRRLDVAATLLKSHSTVAPVFSFLETTVLPAVTYTELSLERKGTVSIRGVADSYARLGEQVKALEAGTPRPEKVQIAEFSVDEETRQLLFRILITMPDSAFTLSQ